MNKAFTSMLMATLIASSAVSCSSNEIENEESPKVTIAANLQDFTDEESSATRTYIEVSATDQISYKWGVGDVLGIFPDAGTQVAFELSSSSLSADGLSATFDGGAWALKGGHSYYAYFPFSYDCFSPSVSKSNIPISYLGQKQTKFNNTTNAGQYDFNAAGPTSSTTSNLSFNFVRIGALLRIKLTLPASSNYKTLTLNTSSASIPVKGTVDLTSPSIAYEPKEYSSSITVDLNNAFGFQGQTAYVYIMLPPMNLNSQGKNLTATLKYGNKFAVYNLCTSGTTNMNTPDFKANTRYKRDAVYYTGGEYGEDIEESGKIYYGYINENYFTDADFTTLTKEMISVSTMHSMSVTQLPKTSLGKVNVGDVIVILIPATSSLKGKVDSGLGNPVDFNTDPFGANGEVQVEIDGVKYKVYGQYTLFPSEYFIYIM